MLLVRRLQSRKVDCSVPLQARKREKETLEKVTGGLVSSRKFEVTSTVQEKRKDVVGEDIKGNPAVRIDE
jgi:hypothetical protein